MGLYWYMVYNGSLYILQAHGFDLRFMGRKTSQLCGHTACESGFSAYMVAASDT